MVSLYFIKTGNGRRQKESWEEGSEREREREEGSERERGRKGEREGGKEVRRNKGR